MKIKIITIHAMHNPGSVLQAYALQEYLNKENNVKIIDYQPDYFYNEGNKIKLLLKKILFRKQYRLRNKKFMDFVYNNMNLTDKYKTYQELIKANLLADVFIVGSDQLWNTDFPCGNDLSFYLKFIEKGKKISYSTSIGKKIIDEKNKKMLIDNLKEFKHISVREKSTSITLSNLLEKKINWVCDPVFLLPKEKYMSFINKDLHFINKYVVVYLAPKSKCLDNIIKYYKNMGLDIILVGGVTKRCYCDKHIIDTGPEDFLNLIYHAETVVSTSFHATAFCLIFHKNFISILPERNGERIISLLEQTNLTNRCVKNDINIKEINKPIIWDDVDVKLNSYIEESKEYLNNAIKA